MRIMIVGGGGREHALAWKIAQSPLVEEIICVPGNAGISGLARCIEPEKGDVEELALIAQNQEVDLTLVGPEDPLVEGIVDVFRNKGLCILGPEKEASRLEGSKIWAKQFMENCGIPTSPFKIFYHYDEAVRHLRNAASLPVIKADGLAAGKGVLVPRSLDEAEKGLKRLMIDEEFGNAGEQVVLEEKLEGEEASLLALTDGDQLLVMPPAQDHKPVGEGDTGPNTGGMGAYSPAHVISGEKVDLVKEKVFKPLLKEMKKRGLDYRGIIYAGLMINKNEINVLEFNVRLGDPEAQAILPRLDSDVVPLLHSAAKGKLEGELAIKKDASVCVVLASSGYPGPYEKGKEITGLDNLESRENVAIFHAGTKLENGKTVTSGGRVLGVTAWHPGLKEAINRVYRAIEEINFEGCYYRRDIANKALN